MTRIIFGRTILVAIIAVIAVAIHGCLLVEDRITGLDRSEKSVGECIKTCNNDAKQDRAAERDLHTQIARDCDDNQDCLAEEETRHEAAMQSIADAQRRCKRACHNQGGGEAGG